MRCYVCSGKIGTNEGTLVAMTDEWLCPVCKDGGES